MLKQTLGLRLDEYGAISSGKINICITTIGNDGIWYGYKEGSYGVITPNAALDGIDIFSMRCKADGSFVLSFGDAGNDQLDNVKQIEVTHYQVPDANIALWDETETGYIFTDAVLADILINGGLDEICFWIEFMPKVLIDYDFSEILVGEKI